MTLNLFLNLSEATEQWDILPGFKVEALKSAVFLLVALDFAKRITVPRGPKSRTSEF